MDLKIGGKSALVVGGSRGIGRAAAALLAAEGVRVAIASRDPDQLRATADELTRETGGEVRAFPVDVRDDTSVRAMVARVEAAFGGIDILVNSVAPPTSLPNSGVPVFPNLEQATDEVFFNDFDAKVGGYLRTARAVAPIMAERGWGRIINVGGLGAREARSLVRTVRNVSVAALTKNLADELGPHGINVTVVHPGATRTESSGAMMQEIIEARAIKESRAVEEVAARFADNAIGRIVDAAEIAPIIAFLASPLSVAITGDAIAAGGGKLGAVYY